MVNTEVPAVSLRRQVVRRRTRRTTSSFGGFFASLPFTLPAFVLVGLFLVYPLFRAIYLAFTSYRGYGDPQWVGFGNFTDLFTNDPVFLGALTNTLLWIVVSTVIPLLIAIPVAIVLNGKLRGRTFFRGAFYLPAVLSSIVIAMSWNFVYASNGGFLNQFLQSVGLGYLAHDWLGDPATAIWAVMAVGVWSGTGAAMVLILAGLQAVPVELVEACRMDGGGRWRVFTTVELPTLRPTLQLVVLLAIINGLKSFDLIAAMTGGGPGGASQVLSYYAWTKAIPQHNYGVGAAIAVILLILSIVAIIPYARTTFRNLSS